GQKVRGRQEQLGLPERFLGWHEDRRACAVGGSRFGPRVPGARPFQAGGGHGARRPLKHLKFEVRSFKFEIGKSTAKDKDVEKHCWRKKLSVFFENHRTH